MHLRRWLALPLLAAGLALAADGLADDQKPAPPAAAANPADAAVYDGLRTVINTGADLYNNGDAVGCWRFYEGALIAYRPVLAHRANLQKAIDDGLTMARGNPVTAE